MKDKYKEPHGSKERVEEQIRIALDGHPDSQLWGENGLLAATMRCVYGYEKLERELTAARAEVAEMDSKNLVLRQSIRASSDEQTRLKVELSAVTSQRDKAWQTIAEIKRDIMDDETFGNVVMKLWQEPLDEAMSQRDRLAEALKDVMKSGDSTIMYRTAEAALQSLTTNEPK
jgi:septal ring factor EnvC (AmiA/AmiB activator)